MVSNNHPLQQAGIISDCDIAILSLFFNFQCCNCVMFVCNGYEVHCSLYYKATVALYRMANLPYVTTSYMH